MNPMEPLCVFPVRLHGMTGPPDFRARGTNLFTHKQENSGSLPLEALLGHTLFRAVQSCGHHGKWWVRAAKRQTTGPTLFNFFRESATASLKTYSAHSSSLVFSL